MSMKKYNIIDLYGDGDPITMDTLINSRIYYKPVTYGYIDIEGNELVEGAVYRSTKKGLKRIGVSDMLRDIYND